MKIGNYLGILLLAGLFTSCSLGSGGRESLSQLDSLRQELRAEQVLNAQYQTYLEEVCLPETGDRKPIVVPKPKATSGGTAIPYPQLNLRRIKGQEAYVISTRLEFIPGKYLLDEAMKEQLKPIADSLLDREDLIVTIEGHTDNQECTQDPNCRHSWALSNSRAAEVAEYMVVQGVFPSAIRCVGKGKFIPAASNRTAAGQALNRRVEIILSRKK
ncbi:MAG: OmpA family protein [Bacteroidota bacterium]